MTMDEWQPMSTAPKDANEVRVRMADEDTSKPACHRCADTG
jgi:hypothetical protein